jgi:hypothetical protein
MALPMQKRYDCIQCANGNTDIILQNQKQGFCSELILNVYGIHLRKVAGAFAEYGEHTGALVLCTAAVSVLFFTLLNLTMVPCTRQNGHFHFGHLERT